MYAKKNHICKKNRKILWCIGLKNKNFAPLRLCVILSLAKAQRRKRHKFFTPLRFLPSAVVLHLFDFATFSQKVPDEYPATGNLHDPSIFQ